jgi:hypothetical protein
MRIIAVSYATSSNKNEPGEILSPEGVMSDRERGKMKKWIKILLGLATLWPFLYLILFFLFAFSSIFFMSGSGESDSGVPFFFIFFFAVHIFTILWIMGLTVFYMINVFRNDRVDKDKKVLWAVVLFMGSIIAMPIYWYLYIWKDKPAGSFSSPAALGSGDTSGWVNDARASGREQEYVPPTQPPDWR